MPSSTRRLVNTPSSGKDEVRAALEHAHARSAASAKTAALLKKRHLSHRVTSADVTTVLAALVSDADAVNPTGTLHYLTTAGIKKARSRMSPRHIPTGY